MIAGAPAARTIDVAHEARHRRWTYHAGERFTLEASELQAAGGDPADTRIGAGGPIRIAVLSAPDDTQITATRRGLLAAGAEVTLWLGTGDSAGFAERAEALRAARPDLVIVLAGEARHGDAAVALCEALRAGCADQSPAPRAVVTGDARTTVRLHATLAAFGVEVLPDPRRTDGHSALVGRIREFRRGTDAGLVLREEALEELARSLARAAGAPALVADVAGAVTSLVHATPEGALLPVHVHGIGVGRGADAVVARAGLDAVRRWIPRAVDAPGLLERVFNRARWPDALSAEPQALALEIALAHEALAHAFADAERAGVPVSALRSASVIALTGRVADLPRAAQSLLVAVDAVQPTALCSVLRDAEDALLAIGGVIAAERDDARPASRYEPELGARHHPIALVASLDRAATLHLVHEGVKTEERVEPGDLRLLPLRGEVELVSRGTALRGRGATGPLGLLIDGRGRPLTLPLRDAERVPEVARWSQAVGAI